MGSVWCPVQCILCLVKFHRSPLSPLLLHCPSAYITSDGTSCSTSSARTVNSAFLKIFTRVVQVAGRLPLPPNHSIIISVQQATGFNGLDAAIVLIVYPVGSKFMWIPTVFHSGAMCLIISTFFPEGVTMRVSCSRVGCVSGGDVASE